MLAYLRLVVLLVMAVRGSASTEANIIDVLWKPEDGHLCTLNFQGVAYRCALGKNGVARPGVKEEGDGKTPAGEFPLIRGFYRQDKFPSEPVTAALHLSALQPLDGWCDDPASANYNKPVTLPTPQYSAETLYRSDDLYDLLAVIEYNTEHTVKRAGSAIFFHVASADYGPTAGCVAMNVKDLQAVLSSAKPGLLMRISYQ